MILLTNAAMIDANGYQQSGQALVIQDGMILWRGSLTQIPKNYLESATEIEDCHDQLITPGLIDCHTHLVYAGNRADEFRLRLEGKSYAEIALAGGGIVSTVRQTRAASEEELFQQSLPRFLFLISEGVTTVEIKSGYGLDLANESKMLRVARRLGSETGIRVRTTFLGAHAIPPEFKDNRQGYVDLLCSEMMPSIAESGLADAIDVFSESIGFSLDETAQLFSKAQSLGLPIKCHAEQLSNFGASVLAAQYQALSCDHLEFLDDKGAKAMAAQGTVAVLLPGAYYYLAETHKPPIDLLRENGVKIALATDCNPGSSPTTSLLLMLSMACRFFGLTVPEALAAVTSNAACALGLGSKIGRLEAGYAADLVRWSTKDSSTLCYHFGYSQPHSTMIAGKWFRMANHD